MKLQFRKLSKEDTTGEFFLLEVLIPVKTSKSDKHKVLNSYRGTTKRDCFLAMQKSFGRHIDDYSALIEEV